MSWERMNENERPRYLIGKAILRHLESAPRDRPESVTEIEIICKVLETRLTADELHHVVTHTGWDITSEFTELKPIPQRPLPFPPKRGFSDDDIPF